MPASRCGSWCNRVAQFHVPVPESPAIECRDRTPSPLEQLKQRERVDRMQNAMATLSECNRTAIRLRDLERFTMAQTAKLRKSEPAAKSVRFRVGRRLNLALSGTGQSESRA